MTREKIVSSLVSYKGQFDYGEDITLDVTPNRGEIYKALGVDASTNYLDPNSVRYKDKFIFFNILNYKVLWNILHNVPTKHIDRSTNKLVRLLKEAELGGWVLSPRVNDRRGRSNLVVIVKHFAYCNIKNIYQASDGFESCGINNDETQSIPSEHDGTDPYKNDEGDSNNDITTNEVLWGDNRGEDSRLTKEGSANSGDKRVV